MTDAYRLFAGLYGASLPEGLAIHVRTVANTKTDASVNKSYTRLRWYTLDTLPDTWPTDANVWFGVGLRPHTSETAGEKNPVVWTALWADLDDTALGDLRLPDGFPLPTAIVNSGRGLHLYWVLRERLTDPEQVKRYLKHIQMTLGSDKASTDPERILRVPGTLNVKHADAPACTLIELHAERTYDLGAFGSPDAAGPITPRTIEQDEIQPEPLAYEDAKWPADREWLKAYTWAGFSADVTARDERIKSQSEFLWHIAMALHDGGHTKAQIKGYMLALPRCLTEKDRADPKRKIDNAIHGGVARATKRDAMKKSGLFPNADGCLCAAGPKGEDIEVTNFDITAHEVYDNYGEQGGYLLTIDSKRLGVQTVRKKFDKKVVTSLAEWRKLAPLSYEIREPRFFAKLQVYLNAQRPRAKELVEMLGWYRGPSGSWDYLVTSEDTVGRTGIIEETPYRYGGSPGEWPLRPHPRWQGEASAVLARLLEVQEPAVVWALLGWTMSTFIAPRLREVRGGWEHGEWFGLWMWGMQGSGKSTATGPFLRLTGLPNRFLGVAGDDSTKVGLQRLLMSSNTSPVWIDDPRKQGLDRDSLFTVMRGVLNAAQVVLADEKGAKTAQRFLRAPLLVSSEHAIEHDNAMRERYLHVPWHKPWKDENPQTEPVIKALAREPLERLARGFFQFFWDMPVEKLWDQALMQTDFLHAGDRPQHAIAQVLLGLEMAKAVNPDLKLGADYETIAQELWLRSTEDTGTKPEQQQVAALKDIYDLAINYAKNRGSERLNEGEDWRLDGDAVHINFNRLKHLLEYYKSNVRPATVRQAVEQNKTHATFRHDVKFRGGKMMECITFNLAAAEADLWDNPWPGLNMGGML